MNLSGRLRTPSALALFLACSLTVSAQWGKKHYSEWSEKESLHVLNDSPWGQTEVFTTNTSEGVVPDREGDPNRAIDQGGSRMRYFAQVNFRIRFLTAKPVRQAISRLYEINRKGELSLQFKEKLKAFVAEESPDSVIVSVYPDAARESVKLQRARELLARLTTEALKGKAYLAVADRRVYLEEYQQPAPDGIGARFIFPRQLDGKPLLGPGDDSIRFYAELSPAYTLDKRYKAKNMVYEGRLEY
ncbi:MAG TPA: hypothetical protein VNO14_13225 [Blastocatellia bacterium]|nr:hypothetical protein [Blastocatellia bacterium]